MINRHIRSAIVYAIVAWATFVGAGLALVIGLDLFSLLGELSWLTQKN